MPQFTEFSPDRFRAGHQQPLFSLDSEGKLSFNYAAYLALEEPQAIVLLFDQAERIVASRKVSPDYYNALAVRREQADPAIYVVDGSQDFVTYYAIPTLSNQTLHFPAHEYAKGVFGFSLTESERRTDTSNGTFQRAITSKWRHTTDGGRVPNLMRLSNVTMSHPGISRLSQSRYSSIRVGVVIACSSIDQDFTTTEIRSRFLSLLRSRAISNFLEQVTGNDSNAKWAPYAGRGAEVHEAILAADNLFNDDSLPLAAALLHLPERGGSGNEQNPYYATLLLEAILRESDRRPPEAAPLSSWYNRFRLAFAIPEAFRRNLTEAMKLRTFVEPSTEAGIWLDSPHSLLEIVDIQNLRIIPGSPASNWFMGFAMSDPNGKPARQIAADFLNQLCDYTLHLDGYERTLAKIVRQ